NQEKPAKLAFCEAPEVYQRRWSPRLRARPKLTAFCTLSRSFSSLIAAAIRAASATSSGEGSTAADTSSSGGSGRGPGAKRSFAPPSRSEISAARCPSSNAHTESAVCTCTVPSRAMRAGHALRAICGPTAAGQRSSSSAMPACGPNRASSPRRSSASRSTAHLDELRGLEGKRRGVRGGDHRLPHAGDPLGEHAAAARVELGEDVVEEQERRRVEQRRLREQQREHREPLLALRPELAQVAAAA